MITIYVHQRGETRRAEHVDPKWLDSASAVTLWVDLCGATAEESRILSDVFRFHPLSIEDALSAIHHPKVETYPDYLYLILHGIDYRQGAHDFATRDVDFFLGRNYLVTVHDGKSRSIAEMRQVCDRHEAILAEGAVALLHRIVASMVDHYRPEIEALEERIDRLEDAAVLGRRSNHVREILAVKRNLASLRRVVIPQRDAVGRLARREFPQINDEMTFRFRDVHDHFVRISGETTLLHDLLTGILEAHLSAISNRLNQVMKVLTVMSTIFLPLTVLTGMWGMNILLPVFPGGEAAQFWWVAAVMIGVAAAMLAVFRFAGWL